MWLLLGCGGMANEPAITPVEAAAPEAPRPVVPEGASTFDLDPYTKGEAFSGPFGEGLKAVVRKEFVETLQRRAHAGLPVDETRWPALAGFEAFKADAYVRSGVFPKRYTGYLDQRTPTGPREGRVIETVICVTAAINGHQASVGSDLRITEAEVAVTFLAEGAALMLDTVDAPHDDLHPVLDVGLDDLASGSGDLQRLVAVVDTACTTQLGNVSTEVPSGSPVPNEAIGRIPAREGYDAYLMRGITLDEAVAGTGIMWVWESAIADRKLEKAEGKRLMSLEADQRFIASSLVYNSGILHQPATRERLRTFGTADYVYGRSKANVGRRPEISTRSSAELAEELASGLGYRNQPTSWLAVYHVLQRYGAWVALHRFDRVFDDEGRFVTRKAR